MQSGVQNLSAAGIGASVAVKARRQVLAQTITKQGEYEGPIRLATPGSVGLALYPRLLELQRKHPQLSIEHRFAPNRDIEQLLINDQIDLGVITRTADSGDIICRAVASEPLVLVTPATIETPDWATLCALGFINHPDGYHHAQLLLAPNFKEFTHAN